MGLTHNSIIRREQKKYNSDWLTFKELQYGNYRFDLFAFNPKTKEIEITEVDVAAQSDEKKIEFAKTLGKTRVFRNMGEKIIPKEFQIFVKAASNVIRMAILELLYDKGKKKYSDILFELKFKPSKDAGRFAYHLKTLLNAELIGIDKEGSYIILAKGAKLLRFCRELVKTH